MPNQPALGSRLGRKAYEDQRLATTPAKPKPNQPSRQPRHRLHGLAASTFGSFAPDPRGYGTPRLRTNVVNRRSWGGPLGEAVAGAHRGVRRARGWVWGLVPLWTLVGPCGFFRSFERRRRSRHPTGRSHSRLACPGAPPPSPPSPASFDRPRWKTGSRDAVPCRRAVKVDATRSCLTQMRDAPTCSRDFDTRTGRLVFSHR